MEKFVCSGCKGQWCRSEEYQCVPEIFEESKGETEMTKQETHDTIEDIVVAYSKYLDENVANTEMDDIHIGVDLLNQAEQLGYRLDITRDMFTEDLQCIPGFVYAINSEGDICY